MQSLVYYFWVFFFGSILGVVIETAWCLIKNKRIESRKGLIYGPFNPLYGVAALALTYSINALMNKSIGNVFIIGVVISSIVEYACSLWQEKVLGTQSWNYKNFRFNLNGRINFIYSIAWGILTLFWYQSCMPLMNSAMPFFLENPWLTKIALIFMIFDIVISLIAGIRRLQRKKNIYRHTKIEDSFDNIYNDERMEKIYPNSKFVKKDSKKG